MYMSVQEGQKSEREEEKQALLKLALCGRGGGSTYVFLAVQHVRSSVILYISVILRTFTHFLLSGAAQ